MTGAPLIYWTTCGDASSCEGWIPRLEGWASGTLLDTVTGAPYLCRQFPRWMIAYRAPYLNPTTENKSSNKNGNFSKQILVKISDEQQNGLQLSGVNHVSWTWSYVQYTFIANDMKIHSTQKNLRKKSSCPRLN